MASFFFRSPRAKLGRHAAILGVFTEFFVFFVVVPCRGSLLTSLFVCCTMRRAAFTEFIYRVCKWLVLLGAETGTLFTEFFFPPRFVSTERPSPLFVYRVWLPSFLCPRNRWRFLFESVFGLELPCDAARWRGRLCCRKDDELGVSLKTQ